MKRWIRKTLVGVFGASVVLGVLTGCGYRSHDHAWNGSAQEHARHRDKMVDRVARRMDLDAAQKAKLAALADTMHAQYAAVHAQGDPRSQFRGLVAGDKFDRVKAQALAESAAGAINARSPAVIAAFGEFYDSLDARQQALVRERLERRHGWWHRS